MGCVLALGTKIPIKFIEIHPEEISFCMRSHVQGQSPRTQAGNDRRESHGPWWNCAATAAAPGDQ